MFKIISIFLLPFMVIKLGAAGGPVDMAAETTQPRWKMKAILKKIIGALEAHGIQVDLLPEERVFLEQPAGSWHQQHKQCHEFLCKLASGDTNFTNEEHKMFTTLSQLLQTQS